MKVTFAPKGILQIDDARIIFRNFAGRGSSYNREGDRDFSVVIDDEDIAEALEKEGWNVKRKPPRNEGDDEFIFLKCKVKFNDYGPRIFVVSGDNRVELDEESASQLDSIDILTCNMDIRPYDWDVNGKQGKTAYLQAIEVYQNVSRFERKREEVDY